jgi:hypothetical protein
LPGPTLLVKPKPSADKRRQLQQPQPRSSSARGS